MIPHCTHRTVPPRSMRMHYISMAAARFELKFAAYAEGSCKPTAGIRPTAKLGLQVGICRSASAANDGITAAGAHAHAAATQPRSASRYINRTAAKITAQPSTSSAQSISQRIRIGFGLSAAAMRALKPNTAMPHTHHCDNILHISSFLHTGIDM